MDEKTFVNYNDAIRAALDWWRGRNVVLEETFEAKRGIGMRSLDGSSGYRLEFDQRSRAHINSMSGVTNKKALTTCFPETRV